MLSSSEQGLLLSRLRGGEQEQSISDVAVAWKKLPCELLP